MDNKMDEYIRQRILALLKQRGWTDWRLAEESGMDQSTISAWYTKKRVPSIPSLSKICDAFGITLCQFFAGEDKGVAFTEEQNELFEIWVALDKPERKLLLELIKLLKN
jgi:transcriptional regulator with XRE-family HTH domain